MFNLSDEERICSGSFEGILCWCLTMGCFSAPPKAHTLSCWQGKLNAKQITGQGTAAKAHHCWPLRRHCRLGGHPSYRTRSSPPPPRISLPSLWKPPVRRKKWNTPSLIAIQLLQNCVMTVCFHGSFLQHQNANSTALTSCRAIWRIGATNRHKRLLTSKNSS